MVPSEPKVRCRGLPRFLGNIAQVPIPPGKKKGETSCSKFGEKLWSVTSRREIPAASVSWDVCPCKAAGQRCQRGETSPPGEHLQLTPVGCKTHNYIILGMLSPFFFSPPSQFLNHINLSAQAMAWTFRTSQSPISTLHSNKNRCNYGRILCEMVIIKWC